MKKTLTLFVLGLLILVSSGQDVLIQSDGIGEELLGGGTLDFSLFDYGSGMQMPVPGAKIIWTENWNSESAGATITVVETFKAFCSGPISVHVNADNIFEVQVNTSPILLTGSNLVAS